MESAFGTTIAGLSGDANPLTAQDGGGYIKARFVHRDGVRYRRLDDPRIKRADGAGDLGETKQGEADVVVWDSPNELRMITHIFVPCPRCTHMIVVPVKQRNIQVSDVEQGALTIRAVLGCPAHWEPTNAHGHAQGRHVKCGFQGVFREGHVHHPKCPCADFRIQHHGHTCKCGGLLTDREHEARENQASAQRRSL